MSATLQATTIERLKTAAYTSIDENDTSQDEWLTGAIAEVSAAIEQYIGGGLKQETGIVEVHDVLQFQREWWLKRYPVSGITSVEVRSSAVIDWADATLLQTTTYDFTTRGRLLVLSTLSEARLGLRVTYDAGYAVDTETLLSSHREIASAAERQVAYMFRRKNDPGRASVTIAGQDQVFQDAVRLLPSVKETLKPLRRMLVV